MSNKSSIMLAAIMMHPVGVSSAVVSTDYYGATVVPIGRGVQVTVIGLMRRMGPMPERPKFRVDSPADI